MKLQLIAKNDITNKTVERVFQVIFASTDNYVTGGVTLDFTAALNPYNWERGKLPANVSPTGGVPLAYRFRVNQVPAGYDAEIIVNTSSPTLKNYLFKITSSGGTEISASGVPSGIYGDVNGFTFSCVTPKQFG